MAEITTTFYRNLLDEHDQAVYNSLMNQLMHYQEEIVIDIPHESLGKIIQSISWDIPLLFYIDFYQGGAYYQKGGKLYTTGHYQYPKEEAKRLLEECKNWGNYIISKMPSGLTEVQRVLWLHDAVAKNVQYDHSDKVHKGQDIVSVIRDKLSVCAGISKTFKYLCDLAGQPCMVVIGQLNDELHAWNLVWISGEPSFIDVTNDLKKGMFAKETRLHFLRSSAQMQGYTWDKSIIPECRLHNQSDVVREVYSPEEMMKAAKICCFAKSLVLHLHLTPPPKQKEILRYIHQIKLHVPLLMTKKAAYCLSPPTIIFEGKG